LNKINGLNVVINDNVDSPVVLSNSLIMNKKCYQELYCDILFKTIVKNIKEVGLNYCEHSLRNLKRQINEIMRIWNHPAGYKKDMHKIYLGQKGSYYYLEAVFDTNLKMWVPCFVRGIRFNLNWGE
jgi:hypothetical protein